MHDLHRAPFSKPTATGIERITTYFHLWEKNSGALLSHVCAIPLTASFQIF